MLSFGGLFGKKEKKEQKLPTIADTLPKSWELVSFLTENTYVKLSEFISGVFESAKRNGLNNFYEIAVFVQKNPHSNGKFETTLVFANKKKEAHVMGLGEKSEKDFSSVYKSILKENGNKYHGLAIIVDVNKKTFSIFGNRNKPDK